MAIYKEHENGATIKRLKKIGSQWCGVPDNPEYDVITIEKGDYIIGLVTTHHNKISNKR